MCSLPPSLPSLPPQLPPFLSLLGPAHPSLRAFGAQGAGLDLSLFRAEALGDVAGQAGDQRFKDGMGKCRHVSQGLGFRGLEDSDFSVLGLWTRSQQLNIGYLGDDMTRLAKRLVH